MNDGLSWHHSLFLLSKAKKKLRSIIEFDIISNWIAESFNQLLLSIKVALSDSIKKVLRHLVQ
jgi:hypothetical protein